MSDPRVQNIVRLITDSVQVENLRFLFNLPWARHLFPESSGWNSQKKITKGIKNDLFSIIHDDNYKMNFTYLQIGFIGLLCLLFWVC